MTLTRNPSLACGIDFGTSNTTVSVFDAAGARLLPLEDGSVTLPSAVFFESDTTAAEFGRAAVAAYIRGDDGRLMRGLKSTLGSSLIHEKTKVGARVLSFRDIVARYFGHLRSCLDAETGGGVSRVVLGRPVHFVDGDPAGDRAAQDVLEDIARAHGFREVAFQYEPIAAALHYEQGIAHEELVLIVDIGGGTSDFSIVRVGPWQAQAADRSADILANDGIRLGGTDFDRLLSLTEVMPHLGLGSTTGQGKALMPKHYYLDLATWHRINMLYSGKTASDLKALAQMADRPDLIARMIKVVAARQGHALAMAVEAAKIDLSERDLARLQISALTGGPNPLARRDSFETAIAPGLARISGKLTDVLGQAGLAPDRIGTVFLTGGSAGLAALRQLVASTLPGVRIATGDMLGSVGTGLALEAARRFR